MADDDSRRQLPMVSTGGMDRLVVPESGESIQRRKPFEVDGVVCICGHQAMMVGIAESGKPCPFCGSRIVARCMGQGCATWTCIGCVEKAALVERLLRGSSVLGAADRMFS
jgi:hypothetical protein